MIRRVRTRAQGHVCQRHHHRAGAISGALCLGRMEKKPRARIRKREGWRSFWAPRSPTRTHFGDVFLWLCCERLRYALARTVVVVVSFCMRWCNKRYVLQQIKSSGAPMKQDHLSFLTTAMCATSTAEQTTSRTRTNEPFLGVDVIMMMSI